MAKSIKPPKGTRIIMARWWEHAETPPDGQAYQTLEHLRKAVKNRLEMFVCGFLVHEDATHYHVAAVLGVDGAFSTPFTIAKSAVGPVVIERL